MNSKQKADEIATKWKAKGVPYNAIYESALEAMEWQREKIENVLSYLQMNNICEPHLMLMHINKALKDE